METNFSEILIEIYTFSFKKMHLKISSGKWRVFSLGLNASTRMILQLSTCWRIVITNSYWYDKTHWECHAHKAVDLCGSSFVIFQIVNMYSVYQEQIACYTINVRIAAMARAEIIIMWSVFSQRKKYLKWLIMHGPCLIKRYADTDADNIVLPMLTRCPCWCWCNIWYSFLKTILILYPTICIRIKRLLSPWILIIFIHYRIKCKHHILILVASRIYTYIYIYQMYVKVFR